MPWFASASGVPSLTGSQLSGLQAVYPSECPVPSLQALDRSHGSLDVQTIRSDQQRGSHRDHLACVRNAKAVCSFRWLMQCFAHYMSARIKCRHVPATCGIAALLCTRLLDTTSTQCFMGSDIRLCAFRFLPEHYAKASVCCSYFPAMFYVASSKVNVAVLGNLAFALTLTAYKFALKVRPSFYELSTSSACSSSACVPRLWLGVRILDRCAQS